MPPGQPVRRCAECDLYRPCKPFSTGWLCVDCSPVEIQDSPEPIATDGGQEGDT